MATRIVSEERSWYDTDGITGLHFGGRKVTILSMILSQIGASLAEPKALTNRFRLPFGAL